MSPEPFARSAAGSIKVVLRLGHRKCLHRAWRVYHSSNDTNSKMHKDAEEMEALCQSAVRDEATVH